MKNSTQKFLFSLAFLTFIIIPFFLISSTKDKDLDLRIVEGGDFELTTLKGQVSKKDFLGKHVLIFFGYLSCPDYCPMAMASIAQAFKKLSQEDLNKFRVLFVSVDPDRDNLEDLKNYTEYFHKNIIGATSSQAGIDDIVKRYGGSYRINKEGGESLNYSVEHSLDILLMDSSGEVKMKINSNSSPDELLRIIKSQSYKTL